MDDAAPRAVKLFSSFATLSVPFNFALGASLFDDGAPLAIASGVGLGLLYVALLPWLAGRLVFAFGHDARRFLLESNVPIYLPAIGALFVGVGGLAVSLAATLFLTFGALLRGLSKARQQGDFRFSALLFAISFLLVNTIPHVYYRHTPRLASLVVLLQLVAAAVSFLGSRRATAMITAAGVSLFGTLISFADPYLVPLALLLATAFWLDQRHHIEARWPTEIVALHLLAVAGSVAYLLESTATAPWTCAAIPWIFVPAIAAILWLEKRANPTEALAYALPPFMILILACDLAAPGRSVWTTVPLLTVTFVYAYLRYTRGLRLVLWFLNLFLFEVLLALALGMESIPELPLYLTLTTLAWAFGSVRLRDPLTAAHRTLILWCLAFVTAGLLLVLSLKTVSVLHPQLWLGLGFTAVSLVVAARRSRSSWPIYLTLVLLGIPGLRLKTELGFANGSGLSQVLVGGLLLAPSHQFRLRAVDWHISHGSALLERGTRP